MILTLPDIIENAARSFPKGEAFSCGSDTLTFQELDTKADQLASYLRSLGVCKGDRVGVYMDRCLETVIAIYGIMKSGAVYVPLDPLSPQSRTIFLLEDCNIGHLVTTPKQTKKIIQTNNRL
ncbi:MAG: AMP-binding protein [Bacteroidota bacterium]